MANEENLKPVKTKKEARERGRNGGKASGKAKRVKKAMKEQMEMLLALPLTNTNLKTKFEELGIDTKNMDNQMAMLVAMWQRALKGDSRAFNSIREITGERVQEINVTQVTDAKVQELQRMLEDE